MIGIFKYLINDLEGSLAVLVFLVIYNSGYPPAPETLYTPGIKEVDKDWRGYMQGAVTTTPPLLETLTGRNSLGVYL
jgi:hypothetical protein